MNNFRKIFIEGYIKVKTGLSIGGSSVGMEIGGADKIVVRNPLTLEPYIPGSSLRGKLRSLLEKANKLKPNYTVAKNINIHVCQKKEDYQKCIHCKMFGIPANISSDFETEDEEIYTSRLIVRDCFLTEESKEELSKAPEMQLLYTETKTEVVIDRITSAAQPRTFERVPAGAKFDLEMILTLYDGDKEDEYIKMIFEGLRLLQDDYLGGSGSRGYGKVKVHIERIERKTAEDYINGQGAHVANDINIPDELR